MNKDTKVLLSALTPIYGRKKGRQTMDERKTVSGLKKGDSAALAHVMDEYTAYLYAIASGIMGSRLPQEDVEEIVSESFIALWYNRQKIQPGKLKPYLAAIVRSKAISRLRSLRLYSVQLIKRGLGSGL